MHITVPMKKDAAQDANVARSRNPFQMTELVAKQHEVMIIDCFTFLDQEKKGQRFVGAARRHGRT